jgi:hypothetical protein
MRSSVYFRGFIAALLVLSLMPASARSTMCDLRCGTVAIPGMAMSSSPSHHATHAGSPHDHGAVQTPRDVPDASVKAADQGEVVSTHQCCPNGQSPASSSCSASGSHEMQGKTTGSNAGNDAVVWLRQAPGVDLIRETASFLSTQAHTHSPVPRCCPLRI